MERLRIRLELDAETYEHLLLQSLAERRPIGWQAEVMLRRALCLPFPYPIARREAHPPKALSGRQVCK